jgi:tetratricopeptide (TPR) repeat protein
LNAARQIDSLWRMQTHFILALIVTLLTPVASHAEGEDRISKPDASTSALQEELLDALFGKLQVKPEDSISSAAALQIESQIWTIWMQGHSPEETTQLALASQAMEMRNFDQCEKQLNSLLANGSNHAEVWNKRATLYFIVGKDAESLADIQKTLDIEPRHFGALSGRAMIYMRQRKYPEALAAYREALAINPHMTGARAAVQQLESLMPDL